MGKVQKPFPVNVCTLLRRCADYSAESGSAEREGEVEPHRSTEARVGAVARLGGRARCPFVLLVLPCHVPADADHIRDAVVGAESEAAKVTAIATLDEGAAVHPVQGVEASQEADEAFGLEAERVGRLDRDARSDAPDTERTESARVAVADRAPHEPVDVRVDRSEEPRPGLEHVRRVTTLAPSQTRADREPHVDLVTGLLADAVELGEFAAVAAGHADPELLLPVGDGGDPGVLRALTGGQALLDVGEPTLGTSHEARRTVEVADHLHHRLVGDDVVGHLGLAGLGVDAVEASDQTFVGLELAALGVGQLALAELRQIRLDLGDLGRVLGRGAADVPGLSDHDGREESRGTHTADLALRCGRVADERSRLDGRPLLLLALLVDRLFALGVGRHRDGEVTGAHLQLGVLLLHAGLDLVGAIGLGRILLTRLEGDAGIRVGLGRVGRERDDDERNDGEKLHGELVHGNLAFFRNVVGVTRDPLRRAATCCWALPPLPMRGRGLKRFWSM